MLDMRNNHKKQNNNMNLNKNMNSLQTQPTLKSINPNNNNNIRTNIQNNNNPNTLFSMIHEDKMSFDGDVVMIPRQVIDEIFGTFLIGINRAILPSIHPCHTLWSDTIVSCEWEFDIYDKNGNRVGNLSDWDGCCEFVTIHKKDLLTILGTKNIQSITQMLDEFYRLLGNNNIQRREINQGALYAAVFEIPNFKGTIENITYQFGPDPDDIELNMLIKGIDKTTNQPIDLRLKGV